MHRSPRVLVLAALLAAACRREPAPEPAGAPPTTVVRRPAHLPQPAAAATTAAATAPRAAAPAAPSARGACRDAGVGPEPDGAALKAFVTRRTTAIRDCYEHALKRDHSLGGRFVVRFTVGTCGEVSELAVVKGRAPGELASCISTALRSWKLPFRPAEPVEVEYPFSFAAR